MAAADPAAAGVSPTSTAAPTSHRLDSVDFVRGLVMVIMALDHVRDHFHRASFAFDPTDLSKASAVLFLTRWITHFCAPAFMFLAGTGAFLWGSRGRSKREISWFLLTRGLWLVLLELTVIHWEWNMGPDWSHLGALVIWALGWSMVALAALVYLPLPAITAFSVLMIVGHNALDGVKPESFGHLGWLWKVLHVQGDIGFAPGRDLFVMYPLIPWINVMAAGYGFGGLLLRPAVERRRAVLTLGAVLTAAFVVLRALNVYGDPARWSVQRDWLFTILSFLNCTKYPPSLLFLLMTLGPALLLLGALENGIPRAMRWVVVFGRVPFFYYLLHLLLIDIVAVVFAVSRYGARTPEVFAKGLPPDWGYHLPVIYVIWIGLIAALYPVCRWYAGVKARSRSPWLSYL